MAQRRPVGNLLALAVLSVLVERPMHPYEMATVIRERGKDRDMKIKWGSLYTVVGNMHRHGLIEPVQTSRSGGRPERTTYRITDAGEAEMRDWARELVAIPEPEYPRFEAGLSVLGALGPDEATSLLAQRLREVERDVAAQRAAVEHTKQQVSRLFVVEAEYDLAMRAAEARWIAGLLAELRSGSFPDLEQWRAFSAGRQAQDRSAGEAGASLADRGGDETI